MSQVVVTPRLSPSVCDRASRVTKSLLGYGVLAGPFYVALVLIQTLIRPGFDLTRHDVSLLSNGSLGWIQVANFVVTGAMVIAFAVGARRALRAGGGGGVAAILLAVYGAGLVAAGLFTADPMDGFPAGAPVGHPLNVSLHGMLHIASAGVGFIALIVSCFVLSRRFARNGDGRLALWSRATGVLFAAAFLGLASGSSSSVLVLGFWVALLVSWGWMAAVALRLFRAAGSA